MKIMENEKFPLDDLKNEEINEKREKLEMQKEVKFSQNMQNLKEKNLIMIKEYMHSFKFRLFLMNIKKKSNH